MLETIDIADIVHKFALSDNYDTYKTCVEQAKRLLSYNDPVSNEIARYSVMSAWQATKKSERYESVDSIIHCLGNKVENVNGIGVDAICISGDMKQHFIWRTIPRLSYQYWEVRKNAVHTCDMPSITFHHFIASDTIDDLSIIAIWNKVDDVLDTMYKHLYVEAKKERLTPPNNN